MQREQLHYGVRHVMVKPWVHAAYMFELEHPDDSLPDDLNRAAYVIAYDRMRDRLDLNVRGERTAVKYGLLKVTFPWRGNEYEVRVFPLGGKVDVRRGKTVVLDGRFTPSGVAFRALTPELEPLVIVLSLALDIREKEHFKG